LVGEGGRPLSGGERQRISIGRALLRKKSVLILDEPTASLDRETSRKIIAGIRKVVPTIIMVTHDPELILMGDHQIILEK